MDCAWERMSHYRDRKLSTKEEEKDGSKVGPKQGASPGSYSSKVLDLLGMLRLALRC